MSIEYEARCPKTTTDEIERLICKLEKDDRCKVRMDLLPPKVLTEVARVFTHGARKYGDYNYRHGTSWSRYYAAAMRHLVAWWGGEDNDPESGITHLAHAVCSCMILMDYKINRLGKDTRNETHYDNAP